MIAEVPRQNAEEDSMRLGERARLLQRAGVHALSVRTDEDDTPCGLRDLFSVVQSAQQVPVFRRDWFIHPLQVLILLSAQGTSNTVTPSPSAPLWPLPFPFSPAVADPYALPLCSAHPPLNGSRTCTRMDLLILLLLYGHCPSEICSFLSAV